MDKRNKKFIKNIWGPTIVEFFLFENPAPLKNGSFPLFKKEKADNNCKEEGQLKTHFRADTSSKKRLSGIKVKKDFSKLPLVNLNYKSIQLKRHIGQKRLPTTWRGIWNYERREESHFENSKWVVETFYLHFLYESFDDKTVEDDFLALKEHSYVVAKWDQKREVYSLQLEISEACLNWYVGRIENFSNYYYVEEDKSFTSEKRAVKNMLNDLKYEIWDFFDNSRDLKWMDVDYYTRRANRPETIMLHTFDRKSKLRRFSMKSYSNLPDIINNALLVLSEPRDTEIEKFSWSNFIWPRDYLYMYVRFPKKVYKYDISVIYGLIKKLNKGAGGLPEKFTPLLDLPISGSNLLLTKPSAKMDVEILIKNSFLFFFTGKGRMVFSENSSVLLELFDLCLRDANRERKGLSKLARFNDRKIRIAWITSHIEIHFAEMSLAFQQVAFDLSSGRIKYGLNISEFRPRSKDYTIEFFKENCVVDSDSAIFIYKLHFLKEFARLLRTHYFDESDKKFLKKFLTENGF